MDVSTVSPPPTSPTEGDDLCEIDVTSVTIHSVTLLIGLCGLVGNGVLYLLPCLKWHLIGIFAMAVGDFFFLIFAVPSSLLFLLEDMSCSLIMSLKYENFLFLLPVVSFYLPLFCVSFPTIGNDMTFLCSFCCCCHLKEHLLLSSTLFLAFLAATAMFTLEISLCPLLELEQCQAALISIFAVHLLLFPAPVLISSTIHLIKAKCGSQQQPPKRREIVIILMTPFTLLLILCYFLHQLNYIDVPFHVIFLLACINSTIKPYICFLVGNSWRPCSMDGRWRPCTLGCLRDSVRRIFEEPEENTPSSNDGTMDSVL